MLTTTLASNSGANIVVERFVIRLVPASKFAPGHRVQMIRASRTSLSRGDRFCPPAISPSRADGCDDLVADSGTTDA